MLGQGILPQIALPHALIARHEDVPQIQIDLKALRCWLCACGQWSMQGHDGRAHQEGELGARSNHPHWLHTKSRTRICDNLFLTREVFTCRDMVERRYKQKQWRQKRPPMLPFESYVLVEKAGKKADAAAEPQAALQAPEE